MSSDKVIVMAEDFNNLIGLIQEGTFPIPLKTIIGAINQAQQRAMPYEEAVAPEGMAPPAVAPSEEKPRRARGPNKPKIVELPPEESVSCHNALKPVAEQSADVLHAEEAPF